MPWTRRCFLCNYKYDGKNAHIMMHRFPLSEDIKKQWMKVCNLLPTDNVKNVFICSKHFQPKDFHKPHSFSTKCMLNIGAIPSRKVVNTLDTSFEGSLDLPSTSYNRYEALALILTLTVSQGTAHSKEKKYDFRLVYEWKQIEYKFRSEEERSEAIKNGTFNVGKVEPIDAQYTYNRDTGQERIFVTTPKLGPTGVPATIGIVTEEVRDGNPVIDPYPSWSWHLELEKCKYHRIVSVYRTWFDECDRLWVLDLGVVSYSFLCPPQILAFDLKTDELLHKYEIPYEQYQNISWFLSPTAEIEDHANACENTWLYIADSENSSLLVYSLKENASWKIQDSSFDPDPKYNVYTIAGDTFLYADGIITVALSPATDGPENRKLHYHAMSNIKESWVYVKDLKNRSNFEVPNGSPHLFHTYKGTRDQQSVTEATDREGNLYFSLLIDILLAKWDPKTSYENKNFEIIANDKERMQFPSGLKILPYKGGKSEVLWLFSNAYQRYGSGRLNGNETNFRLFVAEL